MTLVKTRLAIGAEKNFKFGDNLEYSVNMYDNKPFEKEYNNVQDFLKDFSPTKPSDYLIKRIEEEFVKVGGKITFKPKGFKANQKFRFE